MGPIPQATGRTSFVCLYYTKSLTIKFYSQLKQFCLRHFNSTTSGQTTDVNSTLNEFTCHILWPHFQKTLPDTSALLKCSEHTLLQCCKPLLCLTAASHLYRQPQTHDHNSIKSEPISETFHRKILR